MRKSTKATQKPSCLQTNSHVAKFGKKKEDCNIMTTSPMSLRFGSSSKSVDPPLLSPGRVSSKKKNDLLRNYYGLGDAATTSSLTNSIQQQRLDSDSDGFDAQFTFQSLLQENSLSQLLKHESNLLTEIRELDGEKQSLVYNHHHELVSASETIGKVSAKLLFQKLYCLLTIDLLDERPGRCLDTHFGLFAFFSS